MVEIKCEHILFFFLVLCIGYVLLRQTRLLEAIEKLPTQNCLSEMTQLCALDRIKSRSDCDTCTNTNQSKLRQCDWR